MRRMAWNRDNVQTGALQTMVRRELLALTRMFLTRMFLPAAPLEGLHSAFHAPEICLTERSSGGMMAQEPSLSLRITSYPIVSDVGFLE